MDSKMDLDTDDGVLDDGGAVKTAVSVEVRLLATSKAGTSAISRAVEDLLTLQGGSEFAPGPLPFSDVPLLASNVHSIRLVDFDDRVPFWQASVQIFVYQPNADGVSEEPSEGDDTVSACSQWVLPAVEFEGLWDSYVVQLALVYDSAIKAHLLDYATTAMRFSDAGVDSNIVSFNRVVLLHGPPGTGKTSLCKALAQKLSIRLAHRYRTAQLLEINAHSLFSKWFSESGKLVMKLFAQITEMVDDEESLVCVLIDEVESLTAARKSAVSGSEPSDAVRVVNALLTQLDALRRRSNVIVLTTSNITEAIDLAFVDRADIKQYIGLPEDKARYQILSSCLAELMRVGMIAKAPLPEFRDTSNEAAQVLNAAVAATAGFSGRALRKLPFQAHAYFIKTPVASLPAFAHALLLTAQKEAVHRAAVHAS